MRQFVDLTAEEIMILALEKMAFWARDSPRKSDFIRENSGRTTKFETVVPNEKDKKIIHALLHGGQSLERLRKECGDEVRRIINRLMSR